MKTLWRKTTRYWKFVFVYVLVILVLNLLALWEPFCDFYTDNLFGFSSDTYSRLTGLFPFSVGEVMVIFACLTLLLALVLALLLPILCHKSPRIFYDTKILSHCGRKELCRKSDSPQEEMFTKQNSLFRKKEKFRKAAILYIKSWFVFVLTILLVMTLNCSILYHCSKLSVNGNGDKTYTVKELEILRNYIVEQCNEYCMLVTRDKDSNAVYQGNLDTVIKEAMASLSDEYPRLSGYYPKPKRLLSSYLLYQSGTIGIYFPFSMEANCSSYINDLFYGNTACHELSHLKGYIYEDEANYIAYRACVNSNDVFLQYSGYIGVLDYIDGDYFDAVDADTYASQPEIADTVSRDDWCYSEDVMKEVEQKSFIIEDETIKKYSEDFTASYLEYYGAEANYSEVTLLLLQYYDGILY